ncbi:MAG TPA: hypothetical protein VFG22_15135 [Polyangiales bacterium]|nr:hypothetical protein [Polyangiales bacterium]
MTTQALFEAAMGGSLIPLKEIEFARTSGDICTATAHGLATGAGPFKVTTTNADAPSGITVAAHSSLAYTPSTDVEDETVTVAGKVYTWKNAPSADGEVDVNADDKIAAENLAAAINLEPTVGTSYGAAMTANPTVFANVAPDTAVCTVYAKTLDATVGDAIAVAESASGAWAGAGTVLANGASGTDYYVISLTDDTFSLATTKALAIAGTAVTLADAGTGTHFLVMTAKALATGLNDVLTNFLTATGTRCIPAADNVANFWATAIDGVAVHRS